MKKYFLSYIGQRNRSNLVYGNEVIEMESVSEINKGLINYLSDFITSKYPDIHTITIMSIQKVELD